MLRATACFTMVSRADSPRIDISSIGRPSGTDQLFKFSVSGQRSIATWRPVDRGGYRISLNHPGYWPVTITHQLAPGQPPVDMEVRRLGGVDLEVKNRYGNPVAGVEVDLRSDEMGEWVSDWIAKGLVTAPSAGRVTDAEGRLALSGLPNGPYHWRATHGAENREGVVIVPPMARGKAELRLD